MKMVKMKFGTNLWLKVKLRAHMNPKTLWVSTVKMMTSRQAMEEEQVQWSHLFMSKIQFLIP